MFLNKQLGGMKMPSEDEVISKLKHKENKYQDMNKKLNDFKNLILDASNKLDGIS